mmetsp:Transcript_14518/g.37630  ORF Transcript_14518/g.37630 Transcript_14518/m.37630 type:complete len:206 (-) Transcript_14518:545-1162(-)
MRRGARHRHTGWIMVDLFYLQCLYLLVLFLDDRIGLVGVGHHVPIVISRLPIDVRQRVDLPLLHDHIITLAVHKFSRRVVTSDRQRVLAKLGELVRLVADVGSLDLPPLDAHLVDHQVPIDRHHVVEHLRRHLVLVLRAREVETLLDVVLTLLLQLADERLGLTRRRLLVAHLLRFLLRNLAQLARKVEDDVGEGQHPACAAHDD